MVLIPLAAVAIMYMFLLIHASHSWQVEYAKQAFSMMMLFAFLYLLGPPLVGGAATALQTTAQVVGSLV